MLIDSFPIRKARAAADLGRGSYPRSDQRHGGGILGVAFRAHGVVQHHPIGILFSADKGLHPQVG